MSLQGFIKRINTKEGTGKRGKWTLYSFIIEHDNGAESGWVSAGFDKPPFVEGAYGKLDTVVTERGPNYVGGTWEALPIPTKPAVPAGAVPVAQAGSYNPNGRDASIQYQSSRKDALQIVGLLLEHDALPVSTAGAKAGTAKRYEEIKGFVDKLTVEFYGDVQSLRLLSSVVDAGKGSPSADAPNTSAGTEDND